MIDATTLTDADCVRIYREWCGDGTLTADDDAADVVKAVRAALSGRTADARRLTARWEWPDPDVSPTDGIRATARRLGYPVAGDDGPCQRSLSVADAAVTATVTVQVDDPAGMLCFADVIHESPGCVVLYGTLTDRHVLDECWPHELVFRRGDGSMDPACRITIAGLLPAFGDNAVAVAEVCGREWWATILPRAAHGRGRNLYVEAVEHGQQV